LDLEPEQGESDDSEDFINEGISLDAIAAPMRRVIELDRSEKSERDGIAEDKVDVLTDDSVERGLISSARQVGAEIYQADFGEHDIAGRGGRLKR
jgi:hypothetical protein